MFAQLAEQCDADLIGTEEVTRDREHVCGSDRIDFGGDLLGRNIMPKVDLVLCDPAHATLAAFECEQHVALDLALGPGQLVIGEAVGPQGRELAYDHLEHLRDAGRGEAGVDGEVARTDVGTQERSDRVSLAALLADLLEEP